MELLLLSVPPLIAADAPAACIMDMLKTGKEGQFCKVNARPDFPRMAGGFRFSGNFRYLPSRNECGNR